MFIAAAISTNKTPDSLLETLNLLAGFIVFPGLIWSSSETFSFPCKGGWVKIA